MSEDTKPEDKEQDVPVSEDAEVESEETIEEIVEEAVEQDEITPEDRIAALDDEVTDLKDRLLRAVAETENVRRRAQRDKEDMAKYAISNFSRDMLSVVDNLRRALDSVDEETRQNDAAVENLMIGIEMTERSLLASFERTGIKRMEPLGQRFDPNVHEAMFEYEDKDQPAGSVGQVIEAGYMLHARPLRPAKVGITKGGPKFEKLEAEAKAEAQEAPADVSSDAAAYEKSSEVTGEHLNEEL